MRKISFSQAAFLMPGVLLLTACGHDHFDDGYYDDNYSPTGIYEGTITDNLTQVTTAVTGIIDENYDGIFATPSGQYYRLNNIRSSGYDVSAGFVAYSNSGNFANGSPTTSGSISGQYTTPGLQFNLQAQGNDSGSINLNFDNAYYEHSSLPTLAGSFSSSTDAFTVDLDIQSNGQFSGSDSNNCTYSGFFSLVNTQYNAYVENYTLNCGDTAQSFEGLASFVPASGSGTSAQPAQIMLLADDGNGAFINATLLQN